MRLLYQPQSTKYTCVPATQAIALNSLLNTQYTDIDIIHCNNGLAINDLLFLHELQPFFSRHPQLPATLFMKGMLHFLLRERRLPTLEECIETYKLVSSQDRRSQQNLEAACQPAYVGVFQDYCTQLREGLGPFDYHIKITPLPEETKLDEQTFISRVSEGKITLHWYEGETHNQPAYCRFHSQAEIIQCSLSRKALGLPTFFQTPIGHAWLIDRFEGDSVVLLDTHAHFYQQHPEVVVPSEKLIYARSIARFTLT